MILDTEFAATADYAQYYRSIGWTVVPALSPGEGKQGQWKRPAVAWREYQTGVPDDVWQQWYGPQGQFLTRPNIGILTGKRVFVLDIDLYKTPAAAQWWANVLALHNSAMDLETVSQRTGGGGRQLFFSAPAGWTPPTGKTPIGIDIRGMGGFAVLPPSRHESGRQYEWEAGHEPSELAVMEAPQWLCEEIDRLIVENGGQPTGTPAQRTATPSLSVSPIARVIQDGRETLMARHVWGWIVNLRRGAPWKPIGGPLEAEFADAFQAYVRKVKPRLVEPGATAEDLLEREGRGVTAYREKWDAAMALWDTKIAEYAELPAPAREVPEQAPKAQTADGTMYNPETGEIIDTIRVTIEKVEAEAKAAENRQEKIAAGENGAANIDGEFSAAPDDGEDGFDFPEYDWPDASKIPQREFIYGDHYIRKFVSTDISPGGVGKSSLVMAEALAMASGRPLLGIQPPDKVTVAYWNGEDPLDELKRRSAAIIRHYVMDKSQVGNRYRLASGRQMPIVLVTESRGDLVVATPVVEKMVRVILKRKIDVLIIDPFVSSHRVSENDNNAIERVVKLWAQIADATNCAVNLVHHSRKTNGAEVTVEDGRGAVALLAAARSARALNQMSEVEAGKYGIENRRYYFRADNGKSNLTPPPEGAHWYRLQSVTLPNGPMGTDGDKVGVVTSWELPDPMKGVTADELKLVQNVVAAGEWRKDVQSPQWVGFAVAKALNLNLDNPQDRAKVKTMVQTWLGTGALETVSKTDSKRRERVFVVVGRWVGETD